MAAQPTPFPNPTPIKRLNRTIMAVVDGTVLCFGLAVAGLLGLAVVLIPGALGILAMESERAKRRIRKAKDFLLKTNPLTKKETA